MLKDKCIDTSSQPSRGVHAHMLAAMAASKLALAQHLSLGYTSLHSTHLSLWDTDTSRKAPCSKQTSALGTSCRTRAHTSAEQRAADTWPLCCERARKTLAGIALPQIEHGRHGRARCVGFWSRLLSAACSAPPRPVCACVCVRVCAWACGRVRVRVHARNTNAVIHEHMATGVCSRVPGANVM